MASVLDGPDLNDGIFIDTPLVAIVRRLIDKIRRVREISGAGVGALRGGLM